jgi:hypothetical protein
MWVILYVVYIAVCGVLAKFVDVNSCCLSRFLLRFEAGNNMEEDNKGSVVEMKVRNYMDSLLIWEF